MRGPLGILVGLALGAAVTAEAGVSLLGGFRPVSGEESARAVWVNPASIGVARRGSVLGEFVWRGNLDRFQGYSLAAETPRFGFGFQWEAEDVPGVPDWTMTIGGSTQRPGPFRFGWSAEYRGGERRTLDLTMGANYTVSSGLRASVVVLDVLEADTDSLPTVRTWRPGAALRSRALKGQLTYDGVFRDGADTRHWFGLTFDRTKKVRASFAINTTGDWNATFDLVLPRFLFGAGLRQLDVGERRTFIAWDARDVALQGGSRSLVDTGFP